MRISFDRLKDHGNRLGSGRFGRVFEAKLDGERIVYKVMKHAVHSSIFMNEIRIMTMLSHANITRLIGYCIEDNFMCILMEQARGIDLCDYLMYYDIPVAHKKIISHEILETLVYLHAKNIIYRDLKPENIVVERRYCSIKLIDFGLAVHLPDKTTMIQGIAGSHGYMAPEIALGKPYSYPVDLYSYGMTLFSLWTCRTPTRRSEMRIHLARASIPRYYRALITSCIRQCPSQRPTAQALFMAPVVTVAPRRWFDYFCCRP